MMELAHVGKNDRIADLGSGDGRILIAAAKRGAQAEGWEINPLLVLWTKAISHIFGVSGNITVACQSYQNANLKTSTVVFFYNIPGHLSGIENKIQNELKPGTKIVSYKFPLKKYKPLKETPSGLFYYKKP